MIYLDYTDDAGIINCVCTHPAWRHGLLRTSWLRRPKFGCDAPDRCACAEWRPERPTGVDE